MISGHCLFLQAGSSQGIFSIFLGAPLPPSSGWKSMEITQKQIWIWGMALEATVEQRFLISTRLWQMTKIIYTVDCLTLRIRMTKIIPNQVTKITAALFMCLRFGSMEMNPLQDPPLSPCQDGPTSYNKS